MKQVANITEYGNQRSEIITNIVTSLGQVSDQLMGALRRTGRVDRQIGVNRRCVQPRERSPEGLAAGGQPFDGEDCALR